MYSISQKLYALTGSFFVSIFSDPDGLLELSREQKEAGVLWRRPREVFANAKIFFPELRPEDIVQRIVADCSLCASIVVCLLHCRTHDSKVCTIFYSLELLVSCRDSDDDGTLQAALPSLHPRGPDGRLHISPTGEYELKVLFNGAHRRVCPRTDRTMILLNHSLHP